MKVFSVSEGGGEAYARSRKRWRDRSASDAAAYEGASSMRSSATRQKEYL